MSDIEEILDLVDENDQVIDTITREEANTLTADSEKQGFSVGGYVESGEDYLSTVLRETEEEINLKLKPEDVTLVDVQRIDENRYFNALYIYRTNETPDFNTDDFVSAEWLSPQELLSKIEEGIPAKTNIKLAVKRILESGKYRTSN